MSFTESRRTLPDWQLPPGVDRGLWDYVTSESVAGEYDEAVSGSPVLEQDIPFCERHFRVPAPLVDLGSGTGRLCRHFARLGFPCTAVDLSPAMLAIVAEQARRERLPITTVQANLVELEGLADDAFAYAACLFSTLGMIRGAEHRAQALAQFWRVLRPGGVLVLHAHNARFRLGRGLGRRGLEPGDRTMPQIRGGADLTLHHFTRRELRAILATARFRLIEVRPVGTAPSGLRLPWFLPSLRAHGFLVAACKPETA